MQRRSRRNHSTARKEQRHVYGFEPLLPWPILLGQENRDRSYGAYKKIPHAVPIRSLGAKYAVRSDSLKISLEPYVTLPPR